MPMFFRVLRVFHIWAGACLALLLILFSLTGGLLVWKQDYLRLVLPEARELFEPEPEALARIAEAVEARWDNNDIFLIEFAREDFALSKVLMADNHYAYVDARGLPVTEWRLNERWEEWLYDLHHRLLLGNPGLTLAGVAGLALLLVLLAGLLSFWPLRRGLRHGFWPRDGSQGALRLAHRNLGLLLTPLLLLALLTGVLLAFPQQLDRWLLEPLREDPAYSDAMMEGLDEIHGAGSGDWLPAMRRALAVFPGGRIRSARVPNGFYVYRTFGIQQPGEWNPRGLSQVYIDAGEGWMDVRIDARGLPLRERLFNSIWPLHTGHTGSLLYKLLVSAGALLAVLLGLFGLLAFLKGLRRP